MQRTPFLYFPAHSNALKFSHSQNISFKYSIKEIIQRLLEITPVVFSIQWSLSSYFIYNILRLEPYKKQLVQFFNDLSGEQHITLVDVCFSLLVNKISSNDKIFLNKFYNAVESGEIDNKIPKDMIQKLKENQRLARKLVYVKIEGFPHMNVLDEKQIVIDVKKNNSK